MNLKCFWRNSRKLEWKFERLYGNFCKFLSILVQQSFQEYQTLGSDSRSVILTQYLTYERSQFKIPNAINQSTFFNIKLAQTTKFINPIFPNIKINELSTIIKSKAYKREKERKRKRKSHHQIISIMFFMFELLQILPS